MRGMGTRQGKAVLAVILAMAILGTAATARVLEGQQTIFWKKDRIYANGKEVASVTPAPSDTAVPSTPASLTITATTATSVDLSWNTATDSGGSGIAGYKVYRQKGSGAALPVGTVAHQEGSGTASFTDKPLDPSTAYTWTIRAFDNAQNHSAASTGASTTTSSSSGDATAPDAPAGLRGRATLHTKILLEWNVATDSGGSGMAGYKVYRGGNLVSGGTPISGTSYEDTGLTSNTEYSYTVKAIDNNSNLSTESAALNATTARELVQFDDFNRVDDSGTDGLYVRSNTLQLVQPTYGSFWYSRLFVSGQTNVRATVRILNNPYQHFAGICIWGCYYSSPGYRAVVYGGLLYLYYSNWYYDEEVEYLAAATIPTGPGTLTIEGVSSTRQIKVYYNGTLKITYTETDTSRSNSGWVGLTAMLFSSQSSEIIMDDFRVEKW